MDPANRGSFPRFVELVRCNVPWQLTTDGSQGHVFPCGSCMSDTGLSCTVHVWYIYFYMYHTNPSNEGKYSSPMDGIGIVDFLIREPYKSFCSADLKENTFYQNLPVLERN